VSTFDAGSRSATNESVSIESPCLGRRRRIGVLAGRLSRAEARPLPERRHPRSPYEYRWHVEIDVGTEYSATLLSKCQRYLAHSAQAPNTRARDRLPRAVGRTRRPVAPASWSRCSAPPPFGDRYSPCGSSPKPTVSHDRGQYLSKIAVLLRRWRAAGTSSRPPPPPCACSPMAPSMRVLCDPLRHRAQQRVWPADRAEAQRDWKPQSSSSETQQPFSSAI
jgi:hypothetical protein